MLQLPCVTSDVEATYLYCASLAYHLDVARRHGLELEYIVPSGFGLGAHVSLKTYRIWRIKIDSIALAVFELGNLCVCAVC